MDIKQDFPIFQTYPELVYLDNTATTQKPSYVIDGVADYLRSSYANIHRGSYAISEISETLYEDSKKIVAKNIGIENWREVIYTSNSTYALNFLAQSIWRTGLLKKGDKILVSIVEHHANVVPWLILKEDYGIEVEFIKITKDFDLDYKDFRSKLDDNVKVVSLAHVSNTTGQVFDLENVNTLLYARYGRERPLFIVDASQSVPHMHVDVEKIGCDALFFTGHKIFAESGIGVLWAKEKLLNFLKPIFSGGGAIGYVRETGFTHSAQLPDKFEPGTPNLTGAVSLLRAFEYVEQIGGYEKLEEIERELVEYTLEKFAEIQTSLNPSLVRREETASIPPLTKGRGGGVTLIGNISPKNRVGVFTFYVEGIHSHDIAEYLAEHHICVRAGQHCAEPFMDFSKQKHTCRMSLHIYNTKEDIDMFFNILKKAIKDLG